MTCPCGNQHAYRMRITAYGSECNRCAGLAPMNNPDIFFKSPYLDPHLIDVNKPEQRNGVWIQTRAQKAALMQTLGVHEAGDKRHGSRPEDRFAMRKEQEKRR